MIPVDEVMEILREDAWEATEYIGVAPRSDSLGEDHWGIFEYEGALYRVKFVQGNSYWQNEMGQWEDPLYIEWGDDEIECEEVRKVEIVTYRYEPLSA